MHSLGRKLQEKPGGGKAFFATKARKGTYTEDTDVFRARTKVWSHRNIPGTSLLVYAFPFPVPLFLHTREYLRH